MIPKRKNIDKENRADIVSVAERYVSPFPYLQIGTVLIGPNYNCVCATGMYVVVAIYS